MMSKLLNPENPPSNFSTEEKPPVYVFKSIRLSPDITKTNFFCCLMFSILSLCGSGGISSLQLLILLDPKYYNVSQDNAGSVNTLCLIIQSCVTISLGIPYGHLGDKFGRRTVIVLGALSFLLGSLLIPFQKTIFPGFVAGFLLIANATTAFASVPLLADYVAEESRGKAFAIFGMILALAMLIPNLLTKAFFYAEFSLGLCYQIFGISSVAGLLLNNLGLRKGTTRSSEAKSDENKAKEQEIPFIVRMKEAIQVFRGNRWLQISLTLQAFASSDLAIFGSFLTLYVQYLFPTGGTGEVDGKIILNNLQTILIVMMMISLPTFGVLMDKMKKPMHLCMVSLCGGIFSLILFTMSSRTMTWTLYVGVFIFGSTISGLPTIINLINFKHYPSEKRGIMVGFSQLVTNASYLTLAFVNGLLYDNWRKDGPFLVCIGLMVFAVLMVLILYSKIPSEGKEEEGKAGLKDSEALQEGETFEEQSESQSVKNT